MPKSEMLNNVQHQNLKINTRKSTEFGDNIAGALVFPGEFRDICKEYPIYFQKNEDEKGREGAGEFQAIALFGFEQGENLFLTENDWQARYLPAIVRREPFLIGAKDPSSGIGDQKEFLISVDMESPRVSKNEEGQSVFLESGGNSPYLQEINDALLLIHNGIQTQKMMFQVFNSLELLEPFTLDVQFNDGSAYQTSMYYTLNQEKFDALPAEVLQKLHANGYLQLAYLVLSSLSNIKYLIDKKNAKIAAAE